MSKTFDRVLKAAERGEYPRTLKFIWKRWYEAISLVSSERAFAFMNYGYLPPEPVPLEAADEPNRAFIGLYHQALAGVPVEGLRVLEVGSGRGGGAAYIARAFKPAEVVGVDFSATAVRRSRRFHADVPNLTFKTGDAEALPFPDASFDVVINIESSHCYANVAAFVAEAARVLKPGGVFTWADMRNPAMLPALERDFAAPGLTQISDTDLTEGVVAALNATDAEKRARLSRYPWAGKVLQEFAGVKGSTLHKGLRKRDVLYLARRYRKI
ncbi:class I SAM-dependent methyltransferase [Acuticoccus yangtzensis]|uniref:class I SAM-dependent methyltransferase n=1 Tax=Acuticoccus yangtzensis TaxID=1443441 RepID=UPI0009FB6613|nr:class I SAM-dependent methyltransferase [Acuticoccus yangtzensis]